MIRATIIGFGSIGQELSRQLLEKKWSVSYIINSADITDSGGNIIDTSAAWKKYHDVDVVFLAIPSSL